MLIAKELINKAIQHFPRWMNIRKRYFSSNGGLLLTSAAENIEDIQKEINIYIKEFFIDYYNDKCNDIVDFIYRINIGNYEFDKINILLLSDNGKIKYTKITGETFTSNGRTFGIEKSNGLFSVTDTKTGLMVSDYNRTRSAAIKSVSDFNSRLAKVDKNFIKSHEKAMQAHYSKIKKK